MAIYGQKLYRLPEESLVDYYARLKKLRGGSILGTYGMMDQATAAPTTAAPEITDKALGQEVVRQPVQDEDNSDPQEPTKPASLEDMIRQSSGQAFDPLNLLGSFVPGGTLLAAGADYLRNKQIKDALIDSGLTEDQADIAIKDPDYVAQLLYGGQLNVTPKSDYQPTKTTSGSGFGLVTNLFRDVLGDSAEPTIGEPAPTVSMPTLTGMPQGLLSRDGQDIYIASDGRVRDVSGKSAATQAGLRAVTAGMFDTPSYYEDDYAEPTALPSLAEQLEQEVINRNTVTLPITPTPVAAPTVSRSSTGGAGMTDDQRRSGGYSGSNTVTDRYGNPVMSSSGPVRTTPQEDSSSSSSGGGGCFITTATTKALGYEDDNNHILTAFRAFRDSKMGGKQGEASYYYDVAPKIVKAIGEDNKEYKRIWDQYLEPAYEHLVAGNDEDAYQVYKDMTLQLEKKYLTSK